MMNRTIQRSGLPMLFFAAAVLLAAAGIVILVASPFTEGFLPGRPTSTTPSDEAAHADTDQPEAPVPANADEPEAVPPADPTPAPPNEETAPAPSAAELVAPPTAQPEPAPPGPATSTHTVIRGDTLFDLADRYWSDPYLWPMILVANPRAVTDPDYLRQGSVLDIPPRPTAADGSDASVAAVRDAHIEAYRRYRDLGDEAGSRGRAQGDLWLIQLGLIRVNKAHWVLYSGLRYDADLLENAAGAAPQEDLAIVRSFVTRFGAQPGM